MKHEFKVTKSKDQTVYTLESATGGSTSVSGIASMDSELGGMQRRNPPGDNILAQEKKEAPKPRNFVAKNAKMGGAGQHKDKKKAAKQGDVKHKKPLGEEWSQKYKSSINCSHPKGFSQKAHCAGKNKQDESIETEAVCPDCGMCEAHGNSKIYDKCWTGFRKVPGKKRGEDGSCKKIGEDDSALQAFLSKGGQVQQLPYKNPRKSDKTDYGSKHIGTGKGGKAQNTSGKGANTRVGSKPVVSVEDHEIQMASSELQAIAKNAVHLLDLVRKYSEEQGLDAWQQSKITKAADYLNSVLQSVSGEQTELEGVGMPFRGVGGAFNRGDDERHDLDPTEWYIVKDGKMFKTSVYPNQEREAMSRGYSRTRDEAKAKADNVEESGLQYYTGVKKHGKDYMTKAAKLMRDGGSQEELGALKDRLSKAHKGKDKNEDVDTYLESLTNMLERSVSQAQHNLMVGVAHNPQFAQKVKVKQKVGQEFARADQGHDISKLPIRVPKKK